MRASISALALSALLFACEMPNRPDGGTGGGATGGGATAIGGGSAMAGGGTTGGGSATGGGASDGGLVVFGELCDPTLLNGLITSCRVEPYNPYAGTRCLNARYADGGFLTMAETRTLIDQGSVEACALFGAALLRCVAPVFPTCEGVRADGGFPDNEVIARLDTCNALLGRRFDGLCSTNCYDTNEACQMSCDRMVAETCGSCMFECGSRHGQCMKSCLVQPDAGYPDGG